MGEEVTIGGYEGKVYQEGEVWIAQVPEFGVRAEGDSRDAALAFASDAVEARKNPPPPPPVPEPEPLPEAPAQPEKPEAPAEKPEAPAEPEQAETPEPSPPPETPAPEPEPQKPSHETETDAPKERLFSPFAAVLTLGAVAAAAFLLSRYGGM